MSDLGPGLRVDNRVTNVCIQRLLTLYTNVTIENVAMIESRYSVDLTSFLYFFVVTTSSIVLRVECQAQETKEPQLQLPPYSKGGEYKSVLAAAARTEIFEAAPEVCGAGSGFKKSEDAVDSYQRSSGADSSIVCGWR